MLASHLKTGSITAFLALAACPGAAQDAQVLALELNSLSQLDGACRLTFLATNGLGPDLDSLVLETVLLTTDGTVERLTLFDLQALPANKPRVRQFDLAGLSCASLGNLLINGIQACDGDGLAPTVCEASLRLTSRTDVGVQG